MEDPAVDNNGQSNASDRNTDAPKHEEGDQVAPVLPRVSGVLGNDLETLPTLDRFHEGHEALSGVHLDPHSALKAEHPQAKHQHC